MSLAKRLLGMVQAPQANVPSSATVESLSSKLSDAEAAATLARQRHIDALLAAEDGEPADTRATAAALEAASRVAEDIRLALAAATNRRDTALRAVQTADSADRWAQVERLAAKRAALAEEAERYADAFAEAIQQIRTIGTALHELAPEKDDILHASAVGPQLVEQLAREHLKHRGLVWTCPGPWDSEGNYWGNTAGFAARVRAGHAAILSRRQEVL